MRDFKSGSIKVLCNVDLISEGFDVPDCSVVIMLRPTESLVLDIQQSMRCMRYKPNKVATIIDHVANYTRFGLPDTPRQWSLEGRPKKNGRITQNQFRSKLVQIVLPWYRHNAVFAHSVVMRLNMTLTEWKLMKRPVLKKLGNLN